MVDKWFIKVYKIKQGELLMDITALLDELIANRYENEVFEFKENLSDPHDIGEYISALSNAAARNEKKEGYLIWGIKNSFDESLGGHEVVGTSFDPDMEVSSKEPLKHYLLRQLDPQVAFEFKVLEYKGQRVVVLLIPRARRLPTSFARERYIRIGSSKANLKNFPEEEIALFRILNDPEPTLTNTRARYQDLTFNKLFSYYAGKGITLKEENFKTNLELLTEDGDYNLLAQLLSDDSRIPLRVSIFLGESKASTLYTVREFGYNCLLYTLEELQRYGDVLNVLQADESARDVTRREIPLFNREAYNEAISNALLHNRWVEGNEPMVSVFSNRIEILSRGSLAPSQTLAGFFRGDSIPVNPKLAEIFLQLRLTERSGRGVPTIIRSYGEEAFEISTNTIRVTIPFDRVSARKNEVSRGRLSENRQKIVEAIKENPSITKKNLSSLIGISETAISKNLDYLKDAGYLSRVGSRNGGYWVIN